MKKCLLYTMRTGNECGFDVSKGFDNSGEIVYGHKTGVQLDNLCFHTHAYLGKQKGLRFEEGNKLSCPDKETFWDLNTEIAYLGVVNLKTKRMWISEWKPNIEAYKKNHYASPNWDEIGRQYIN